MRIPGHQNTTFRSSLHLSCLIAETDISLQHDGEHVMLRGLIATHLPQIGIRISWQRSMRILHTSQPRSIDALHSTRTITHLLLILVLIHLLLIAIMGLRMMIMWRHRRRLTNRTPRHPPIPIPLLQPLLLNPLSLKIRIRALRLGGVLAVDGRVLEGFDELEFDDGEDRAGEGPDPVDPVSAGEGFDYYRGAERACGVEGAAGPEDA